MNLINSKYSFEDDILEYTKSLTLLCVEDNEVIQLIYTSIFEHSVKEIIFSENGEDGYQKFINSKVDIIITDYFMPVLNGIDMIEKIRAIDKHIPIILVSGIEDVDVITRALQLNVNNFLKKPIAPKEVLQAVENVSKILIADNFIEEQKSKKIKKLEDREKYTTYQEDLAFSKELNILRNDFYYQMVESEQIMLIDFMYKPLDILSGDSYSARKIDEHRTFYLVVDGMGKGLSASLSAILITSYINHVIDTTEFDFHKLIESAIGYIKPILLDEETISVDFILINHKIKQLRYSKFSMPRSLMQTYDGKIIKIRSNNQPISKYIEDFKISDVDISNITKFLFYSDGMVENGTRFKDSLYIDYVEDDFLNSFTKDDLRSKFLWKIDKQEDDITFIFLNNLDLSSNTIATKEFASSLEEIDNANHWYADVWINLTDDANLLSSTGVVFSELIMNAFEHGNLKIDAKAKHELIEKGLYFDMLETLSKDCSRKISVNINRIQHYDSTYIITSIEDEGDGFDTEILSKIFRNSRNFNGRGVFISRRSSLGIYYNSKGNRVFYLHKV